MDLSNYTVSENADVYSNLKGRLLKPTVSSKGYMVLTINNKTAYLHQLVALSYLDADYKSKGLVVDHIDRNPLNNSLDNLRLISKSENLKNSDYFENRKKGYVGLRNNRYRAIITVDGVKYSKTFDTRKEAEEYNNLKQ